MPQLQSQQILSSAGRNKQLPELPPTSPLFLSPRKGSDCFISGNFGSSSHFNGRGRAVSDTIHLKRPRENAGVTVNLKGSTNEFSSSTTSNTSSCLPNTAFAGRLRNNTTSLRNKEDTFTGIKQTSTRLAHFPAVFSTQNAQRDDLTLRKSRPHHPHEMLESEDIRMSYMAKSRSSSCSDRGLRSQKLRTSHKIRSTLSRSDSRVVARSRRNVIPVSVYNVNATGILPTHRSSEELIPGSLTRRPSRQRSQRASRSTDKPKQDTNQSYLEVGDATNHVTNTPELGGSSPPFIPPTSIRFVRQKAMTELRMMSHVHVQSGESGSDPIADQFSLVPSASPCKRPSSHRRSSGSRKVGIAGDGQQMQTLPIILPPNQEFSCHFEWESDLEQERDKAEELWERLALECGMEQTGVQSSPRRGRWKVKVTETPILGGEEEFMPPVSPNSSVVIHQESALSFLDGGEDSPLPAVLREVNDILPPVDQYKRLAAAIRRRTSNPKRLTSIKRRGSKKAMHRDIKRSLHCLWELQPCVDAASSAHMELLMKGGSNSKSTMGRSVSLQGSNPSSTIPPAPSANTGLGINMHRSITMRSTTTDSIINLYMER
ncbi:hypothetical protein CPB86DRAFT_781211 [Serendipita vermifera]|nr:hypothetical protein CPB86DRAFT_781211 [Serendipita vermifera]